MRGSVVERGGLLRLNTTDPARHRALAAVLVAELGGVARFARPAAEREGATPPGWATPSVLLFIYGVSS